MIESTDIQAHGDIFDFLRIIDDEFLGVLSPDEIGSGSNFSLTSFHQIDHGIASDTDIKEKA